MNDKLNYKLEKIDSISQSEIKAYNGQKNIKRRRVINGGYENIIFGTDQDLD